MRYASDTLAQHPFSSTAVRSTVRSTLPVALPEPLLRMSLRALKSCATLAPNPPHSRQVMPGHVWVSSVWGQP